MRTNRIPATAVALACIGVFAAACVEPPEAIRGPVLPFIEDDYTRALTAAKAKKLPIFVESWAPW